MSDLQITHHGNFHGKVVDGEPKYVTGTGKERNRRFWEDQTVSMETNFYCIRLNTLLLDGKIKNNLPEINHEYLSKLVPIKSWMEMSNNREKLEEIKPDIVCNRSVLKRLCTLRKGRLDDKTITFCARKIQNRIELYNTTPSDKNSPDVMPSLVFEKFITQGLQNATNENYDRRERIYSVLSLKVGKWTVLYNAEVDAVMSMPEQLESCPNSTISIRKNVFWEIKLRYDQQHFLKKKIDSKMAMHWFIQCHLAKNEYVIVGQNLNKKPVEGQQIPVKVTDIQVYKTEDLPKFVQAESTVDELERELKRRLETVLSEVVSIVAKSKTGFVAIQIDKKGIISHNENTSNINEK